MTNKKKNFALHVEMRESTLRKIFEALSSGASSKKMIQERAGLSWGAVSEGINLLSDSGILDTYNEEMQEKRLGRKTLSYTFSTGRYLTLGMEPKRDSIIWSVTDLNGKEISGGIRQLGVLLGNENLKDSLSSLYNEIKAELAVSGKSIYAVALSLTGAVDDKAMLWLKAPQVEGISNYELNQLKDVFEGAKVFSVEHDIKARCRSVMKKKNWNDRDYIFFHASDGLGMVASVGAAFYEGSRGLAGEAGHIPYYKAPYSTSCACGKHNCVETYLSIKGVLSYAEKISGRKPESIEKVRAALSPEEDKAAVEFISSLLEYVCTVSVNLFDPATVIIGGESVQPWLENISEKMPSRLRELTWQGAPSGVKFYHTLESNSAYGTALGLSDKIVSGLVRDVASGASF